MVGKEPLTGERGRKRTVSIPDNPLASGLCSSHAPHLAEPDAGIVNFYQIKDSLMGHVDRSEICATSPLVSIS
jgi:alkylated DNA repair dioxygenase AlkB